MLASPESFLGPEHTEHHVVFHHIEVPGDYGAFVRVLNENLVNLKLKIKIFTIFMLLLCIIVKPASSDVRETLNM